MNAHRKLQEDYYRWLTMDALDNAQDRINLEGMLRLLHDIPFYWTIWADSNRAGDALSFRQTDFLEFYDPRVVAGCDPHWLGDWANAAPSVFEVLLGMARRWAYYFEHPPAEYFKVMIYNLGLHNFTGRTLPGNSNEMVRDIVDTWMTRTFQSNGDGSPFPVRHALHVFDMTQLDIWAQMNAYSAEHFQ